MIAQHFLTQGANVVIAARHQNTLDAAIKTLIPFCKHGNQVIAQVTDITNEQHCHDLIAFALHHFGKLDVLVNNAGIHGAKGNIEKVDWVEWVSAIEVNLKGTVLMTRAVLPHLKKQRAGKIIMLSGGGATKPMPNMSAYAVSKAAVVRLVETIAEEIKSHDIDVNAIAPGALNTRLLDDVLQAGADLVGEKYYSQVLAQQKNGGNDIHRAAQLAVFLASSQSDGITGKLISAVWDPWEQFDQHRDALANTDIYTLRRIVPKERGMEWGN